MPRLLLGLGRAQHRQGHELSSHGALARPRHPASRSPATQESVCPQLVLCPLFKAYLDGEMGPGKPREGCEIRA